MVAYNPTQPPTSKQAGFTITELLVTLVLLAISVPVMSGLISMLSSLNDRAKDMATLNALVENKIEGLRSVSFTGISNGTTNFASDLPASVGSPRSATYTISSVNSSLKQIDVHISYNDHGTTRTLDYRTYIGELGVGQY